MPVNQTPATAEAVGVSASDLDIAHELRKAIESSGIGLRYVGRHDLVTGQLVAWVGYLRWEHPIYGDIHPVELLRLAEVTGLATELSLTTLKSLEQDFLTFAPGWDEGVRISFSAPRHHLLHERFIDDIERFLARGTIPPERLELRISVKAALTRAPGDFDSLARRGVQLSLDEMGHGIDLPLDWLARAPLRALQLNRLWVGSMLKDAMAFKMCRASIVIATALGLMPIATAVDEPAQRDRLLALGCRQGTGELYREEVPKQTLEDITEHFHTEAAA